MANLCKLLENKIWEKINAVEEYSKLSDMLKSAGEERLSLITGMIAKDEEAHAHALKEIKRLICFE